MKGPFLFLVFEKLIQTKIPYLRERFSLVKNIFIFWILNVADILHLFEINALIVADFMILLAPATYCIFIIFWTKIQIFIILYFFDFLLFFCYFKQIYCLLLFVNQNYLIILTETLFDFLLHFLINIFGPYNWNQKRLINIFIWILFKYWMVIVHLSCISNIWSLILLSSIQQYYFILISRFVKF